jgi:hypothetical protein
MHQFWNFQDSGQRIGVRMGAKAKATSFFHARAQAPITLSLGKCSKKKFKILYQLFIFHYTV